MSSSTRRLNFTERRRIRLSDVTITLIRPKPADPPLISASINLAGYSLPSEALVLVEAYRHTAWQRFDFGTVGHLHAPADRVLRDIGAAEGVRFRVKVVEPCSNGATAARILAQADSIRPNQSGPRPSLLPLETDPSLRDEVWRLDIDENDGPLVRISSYLVRDRHAFARSGAFMSLALPDILRKVLSWALDDGLPDDDDWDTPRGRWVRFGCGLLGQAEPPRELDDQDGGADARDKWVDQVVQGFWRVNSLGRAFAGWWREEGSHGTGGTE